MVTSGQITPDEAMQLRSVEEVESFERAMTEGRLRHAEERMQLAAADSQMTKGKSEKCLKRIRHGEHPTGLQSRFEQLRSLSTHRL